MADYRELLRRAIDALQDNTGSSRRAIYEKARDALIAQLRAIEPTLPAREITTHRLNLEDCIREVEHEETDKLLGRFRAVDEEDVPDGRAEPQSNKVDRIKRIREAEQWLYDQIDDASTFSQRPAAFQFAPINGRITASAIGKEPATAHGADLHRELRRKAESLLERLARTQAPQHLSGTIKTLVAELGTDFSDVRPGVLLSHSRAIETSLASYDEEDQREELMPDARAALADFISSLDDFKALFPDLLSLEATRLAQGLGLDDVDAAHRYAAEIAETASHSDNVDSSAVEALQAPSNDIDAADRVLADTMDPDKCPPSAPMSQICGCDLRRVLVSSE